MSEQELSLAQLHEEESAALGCGSFFVAFVLQFLLFSFGLVWVMREFNEIDQMIMASTPFGRAFSYGIFLLVIGLPLWFFTRQAPWLALWRGVGLLFMVASLQTFVAGVVNQALYNQALPYPLAPLTTLFLGVVMLFLTLRHHVQFTPGRVALALGFGLLTTAPYLLIGQLGSTTELFLSVVDGWGLAVWGTLFILLPLVYAPEASRRTPAELYFFVVGWFIALTPAVIASRGFFGQGVNFSFLAVLIAFPAVAWLFAGEKPQLSPILAYLASAWFLPTLVTEGAQADFEIGSYTLHWLVVLLITVLPVFILTLLLLLARRWLTTFTEKSLAPAVLPLLLLPLLAVGYNGQSLQSERFFVVLKEQANTDFAQTLPTREERVTAVYETLVSHANRTQADLRQFLDGEGVTYTPFYLVNGVEVEGSRLLRWQISQRPEVDYILESPAMRPEFPLELPGLGELAAGEMTAPAPTEPTWGIKFIQADKVWSELGVTGEGIIVGNADSGVYWQHPALTPSYLGGENNHNFHWYDPWEFTTEPTDTGGHGTHTNGTITGAFNVGVAPQAKWIACRNLARNMGNPPDYLECMQFLFAPFPLDGHALAGDPLRGAHVTNNSWGCPPEEGCDGRTLGIATHHLRNAGQMMVVSAGNSGPSCQTIGEPATNDDVFSVGAMNEAGVITSFSSRGPATDYDGDVLVKPDILAPGEDVISSWIGTAPYFSSQGTSMAGPHITGVVALMWSANPALIGNIEATEQILRETTTPVTKDDSYNPCNSPAAAPDNAAGYGVVNSYAAVQQALQFRP